MSRELYELERMAFVPPGRCLLEGYSPPFNEFAVERALLVDMFEVTRDDWEHYFGAPDPDPSPSTGLLDVPSSWPVHLSQLEAQDLARRRGMRLLSASEWLYCAAGPRGHPYPWGGRFQASVANTLELELGRPAPVGTFEKGRGPFGCYDQLGNVWEWVSDRVLGRGDVLGDSSLGVVSAMGGSFNYRSSATFRLPGDASSRVPVFNALSLAPATRAQDLGVRCAVEAEEYLWNFASRFGENARAQGKLVAVGRRFGSEARSLLLGLARRPRAPRSLQWLAEGASE